MWNYLRVELDRAFKNSRLAAALTVGCLIAAVQVIFEVVPVLKYQEHGTFTSFPHTSYEHYIGLKNGSMLGAFFYMVIPLLMVFPYAGTAFTDWKTGYIKNIFVRTSKPNYYMAKYVTAFLTGGVIAVVPQIVNFLLVSAILPSIQPYAGIGYVGISARAMWAGIYYENAFLYIVLYWLFDFVMYGFLNTLAVSAAWLIKNWFVLLLVPFLAIRILDLVMETLQLNGLEPSSFLRPAQLNTSDFPILYGAEIMSVVLVALALFSGCYGVHKSDHL